MGLGGFCSCSGSGICSDQGVGGDRVKLTGEIEGERREGEERGGREGERRGGSRYLVTHHSRTGNRI